MVEINLISWRTQKRAYEEKMMRQIVAACTAAAIIVMISAHIILKYAVNHHVRQLRDVTATIPQSYVRVNSMVISPAAELAVLLDAAQIISSGLCYQRIAKEGNGWMIEGRALTAQSMLSGLRVFEKISPLSDTALREFKQDQTLDGYRFVVKLRGAEDEQRNDA